MPVRSHDLANVAMIGHLFLSKIQSALQARHCERRRVRRHAWIEIVGEFSRGVEDPGARSKILEIDVRNGTKRRGIRASRAGMAPVKVKWRLSLAR